MKKMPKHIKKTLEEVAKDKPHVCPPHEHHLGCVFCWNVSKEFQKRFPIVQWKEGPERVVYQEDKRVILIGILGMIGWIMVLASMLQIHHMHSIRPPVMSPKFEKSEHVGEIQPGYIGDGPNSDGVFLTPCPDDDLKLCNPEEVRWQKARKDLGNAIKGRLYPGIPDTGPASREEAARIKKYMNEHYAQYPLSETRTVDSGQFDAITVNGHDIYWWALKCREAWTILNKDKDAGREAFKVLDK